MTLRAGRTYDCPRCGDTGISAFRYNAHLASATCRVWSRARAAENTLREVGGYVGYRQMPVLRLLPLSGRRPVRLLASGVDDLGNVTVIDMMGKVRQYLHGEWEPVLDTASNQTKSPHV